MPYQTVMKISYIQIPSKHWIIPLGSAHSSHSIPLASVHNYPAPICERSEMPTPLLGCDRRTDRHSAMCSDCRWISRLYTLDFSSRISVNQISHYHHSDGEDMPGTICESGCLQS